MRKLQDKATQPGTGLTKLLCCKAVTAVTVAQGEVYMWNYCQADTVNHPNVSISTAHVC